MKILHTLVLTLNVILNSIGELKNKLISLFFIVIMLKHLAYMNEYEILSKLYDNLGEKISLREKSQENPGFAGYLTNFLDFFNVEKKLS